MVVTPTEEEIHGPVASLFRILRGLQDRTPVQRRVIVGLGGIPGSGKSTLASFLAYVSTRIDVGRALAVVSIDGWHWPNATLEAMPAVGPRGELLTMRDRKGSPGSYDVEGVLRGMAMLRDAHLPVRLPAYDRRRHEPAPDAIIVPPGVRLILLEGNYVLLQTEPWRRVADQLDLRFFLEADVARARDGVIARHIAGGCSRDQATRKYEINDLPNTDAVLASRPAADVLIHEDEDRHLAEIEVLTERAFEARTSFGPFPPVR